jgi:sporulation protein YlmC with PRC-barrel domain
MKRALLVGAAVLVGTYSAAAAEFYVVQDTSSKQCRVVEQKPTGSTLVIVGSESRTFSTQVEAETAMKNESACNQTAQAPAANQTAQAPKSANPPSTTGAAPSGTNAQVLNDVPANAMTVTNYYKQAVYDPQNNRIGDVDDVLVSPDGRVNALVVGVGGFLGIGEKHVIVPFNAVKVENKDSKVTLVMNSSKDELKAAPGFKYDRSKTSWVKEASR